MSRAWYEMQMEQRKLNRRLDEIAHKRAQGIIKDLRSPSYCMHTPREALQRLGQRHRESFPSDEAKALYQRMSAAAKGDKTIMTDEQKERQTTTRTQDFFKEYGIEETVVPGTNRR